MPCINLAHSDMVQPSVVAELFKCLRAARWVLVLFRADGRSGRTGGALCALPNAIALLRGGGVGSPVPPCEPPGAPPLPRRRLSAARIHLLRVIMVAILTSVYVGPKARPGLVGIVPVLQVLAMLLPPRLQAVPMPVDHLRLALGHTKGSI